MFKVFCRHEEALPWVQDQKNFNQDRQHRRNPRRTQLFSWIFLSVQIGSCTNQLIQCKVHEIFFPTSLHLPKTHSNWGSYAPFSPLLQSASCWFQHVHLRCLRHSSSRGFSIVSIMDALNRGLDGDPEYSTFLHCKSLDLCTKLMRLSDLRSWNLKMLMMVFKILGTVSLLIIWVSCPAWLVKFGASPDMCLLGSWAWPSAKQDRDLQLFVNICYIITSSIKFHQQGMV